MIDILIYIYAYYSRAGVDIFQKPIGNEHFFSWIGSYAIYASMVVCIYIYICETASERAFH